MRNMIIYFFLFLIAYVSGHADENVAKPPVRILVGSPIRQDAEILSEFLNSLDRLIQKNYILHFCFIDDNLDNNSTHLLRSFQLNHPNDCLIWPAETISKAQYLCTEHTHFWKEELIWKVASFKDKIIEYAMAKEYDYLFLIDSDLVLHPYTLEQLLKAKKEVISNVFWTSWTPGSTPLPQVWMSDEYTLYQVNREEALTQEEKNIRTTEFLTKMKTPGTYEVGGLGACTLLSKHALEKGINFKKIYNLSFWGEDRHFCIRAAALGVQLYVDTHYPAYHIYRKSYLEGVKDFIADCDQSTQLKHTESEEFAEIFISQPEWFRLSPQQRIKPRLTLALLMRNEADRYLRNVLEKAREYITDAIIIDDASTDASVEVCKEVLYDIPYKIFVNKRSGFSNEVNIRKTLWNKAIETHPDWILILDADEIFEDTFATEVPRLVNNPNVDVYYFRLYDFWNETHYREDSLWCAHKYYRPFLVRYKPYEMYEWKETPQHCGRFPLNIYVEPAVQLTHLRLKHFGWASEESRIAKYQRYKTLDPKGVYGVLAQYESILDANPHLIKWEE